MDYFAYGLNIESELSLPELFPGTSESPDVHIRYGKVPSSLSNQSYKNLTWEAVPGKFIIHIHKIAKYFVQDGQDIIIERFPHSSDEDVRTFLLGSPLGALLYQRGLFVLHASAIQTQHGAVLFTGRSGSGKSTLTSAFLQRGYAMLSDDISGIDLHTERSPRVLPAIPQTKLWPDVVSKLDINQSGLKCMRKGMDKLQMPIEGYCRQALPIFAVYVLTSHNQPALKIEPVSNNNQFTWLIKNTYRKRIMYGLGLQTHHFKNVAALVDVAKVFQVSRPDKPFLLNKLVTGIEQSWI